MLMIANVRKSKTLDMQRKKLLVTGAGGFLGWNLCQMTQPEWDVYGIYHSQNPAIAGVTQLKLDLTDFEALKQTFREVQPG